MPHIFPKRFLRTRDVVTPEGLNGDLHPTYDALSGRLDRTNFHAANLKGKTRPHPASSLPSPTGMCISEGAYYKIHTNQIESKYRFYTIRTSDDYLKHPKRVPPNFLKLDGATTRWTHGGTGTPFYDSPPSVISNNGAWSTLKNEDLTGPQQLTFTTGQSKIWISAYLQYIWQGFYEEKSPYITGARRWKGVDNLNIPGAGESWLTSGGVLNKKLAFDEASVLNFLGPAEIHEHLADSDTENKTENIIESSEQYAFPLNERTLFRERSSPNACGFHHISKGFFPALVQFAIRVDGKIIEETITGKKFPFEESSHGITVTDSIRVKESDEKEETSEDELIREFLPFFTTENTVFGQRSATISSAYGDSDDCRPGQKVKSSRAVSCGPEVMPIRIGAVVQVQPGTHTIEIVARRLQRKKGKFLAGDFVGVFSRRIIAFDLPVNPQRNDSNDNALHSGYAFGSEGPVGEDIHAFKTEDALTARNISGSREKLANAVNNLTETNLDTSVLSNEYLPSKVTFHRSVIINPDLAVNEYSGSYEDPSNNCWSTAIFPGFGGNPRIDSTVDNSEDGWLTPGSWLASDRAGWYQLRKVPGGTYSTSDDGNILGIRTSDTASTYTEGEDLRPGEVALVMMDVELRGIAPIHSVEADLVYGAVSLGSDGSQVADVWRNFGNWLMTERYLDLFALFAIGYKLDGNWIIGSQATPALVNSYNWTNRSAFYNSGPKANIPFAAMKAKYQAPWDIDPGWGDFTEAERQDLFLNEYNGETPRLWGQGGNLHRSNLGINIPIVQVIENTTLTTQKISEYGGFVSSMVPSHWTQGHSPDNQRRIETGPSGAPYSFTLPGHWASPVGGRKILSGVKVWFGKSRLTVVKTWK